MKKIILTVVLVTALWIGVKERDIQDTQSKTTNLAITLSSVDETIRPLPTLKTLVREINVSNAAAEGETSYSNVTINAESALIKNLDTGITLFEQNPKRHWPLASLTKLLTAAVAEESVGLKKTITLTEEDIATEGDSGEFLVGESYTVSDLIKAMLLVSSNDAASAIGTFYGKERLRNALQEKIHALALKNTLVVEETGLSPLNQSTADEITKIAEDMVNNHRELMAMSGLSTANITEQNTGIKKILNNIHPFAGTKNFIGGKTGFITEAKGNLVTVVTMRGNQILLIILGAEDRELETKKMYNIAENMLSS